MNKNGGKNYLETEIEELITKGDYDKVLALVRLLPRMSDILGQCYIRMGSKYIKDRIKSAISDMEQTIREG